MSKRPPPSTTTVPLSTGPSMVNPEMLPPVMTNSASLATTTAPLPRPETLLPIRVASLRLSVPLTVTTAPANSLVVAGATRVREVPFSPWSKVRVAPGLTRNISWTPLAVKPVMVWPSPSSTRTTSLPAGTKMVWVREISWEITMVVVTPSGALFTCCCSQSVPSWALVST